MKEGRQRFISGWIKNALILALAALCFFQTIDLWLDGAQGFDWFASYSGAAEYDAAEMLEGLLKPKRMLLSKGNEEFHCKFTGITETAAFQAAKACLSELSEAGVFKGTTQTPEIKWADYLSREVIILDYGFLMPASAFSSALGAKSGGISDYIKVFDMIILMPEENGQTAVVLADTLSAVKTLVTFTLGGTGLSEVSFEGFGQNLYYISSIHRGIDFAHMVFMPQSYAGGLNYLSVTTVSGTNDPAYGTQGLARYLEDFFDNPQGLRDDYADGVYTFCDEYTIVKYNESLFLEYTNWRSQPGKSISTFEEAYAEAAAFMHRDKGLANEYYLSGFTYDGTNYVFSFNYVINDLPVRLGDSLKNALGMDHAIEITVVKDRVSRYKRYAPTLANASNQSYGVAVNLTSVISELVKMDISINRMSEVSAMDLVYLVNDMSLPYLAVSCNYSGSPINLRIRN